VHFFHGFSGKTNWKQMCEVLSCLTGSAYETGVTDSGLTAQC
jgi:hypothetical protein